MNDTDSVENSECVQFTDHQVTVIVMTRKTVSGLAFLACSATLLLILVLAIRQKMLATFVGRMKLYITTVALVLSLTYLLQVLPVTTGAVSCFNCTSENNSSSQQTSVTRIKTKSAEWDSVCEAVAGLIQYVSWVMLLLIGWMVLLLLCYTKNLELSPRTHTHPVAAGSHKLELLGVTLTLLLPLLVTWLPYATDNYGLGSRWCGITLGKRGCSEFSSKHSSPVAGPILLLVVWYAPSLLIALMGTIGLIIIVHRFRTYYKTHGSTGHTCSAIIKGIPPITYLVVYNIINVFNMTETTIYSSSEDDSTLRYRFSVAHAVTGPCRALAVPFAFVLSHVIIHRCFNKRKSYIPLL